MVGIDDYRAIYDKMSSSNSIASIIEYNVSDTDSLKNTVQISATKFDGQKGVIGIIGAGNFTGSTILPVLKKLNASVKYVASSKGLSGTILAKKFNVTCSTTNYTEILSDQEVDAVIITTRHNAHARQVIECLQAGKHVFVEKPLALTIEDIESIEAAMGRTDKTLTVGFNRRFSPFVLDAKKQLGQTNVLV